MKNYLALGVILLFLAGGWYSVHLTRVMHTRAKFTIGYLTGGIYTPKSGKKYSYLFSVAGKTYEDTDTRETNMATNNGSRFLVEYDSLDPEISTGHFAIAVPNSIRTSPANGWTVPPFPVPAQVLDHSARLSR